MSRVAGLGATETGNRLSQPKFEFTSLPIKQVPQPSLHYFLHVCTTSFLSLVTLASLFLAGLPREPGEAVRHPLPHVQPEAEAVARRQDGAGLHLRPGMFSDTRN